MDEKDDIERPAGHPLEAHDLADKEERESERATSDAEEVGFEPIRTGTASRRLSTASSRLSRQRSNNGWGVDELDEDPELGNNTGRDRIEPPGERDPFEISWDGGDNDPLNPRSMPLWRKWMIVGIVSFGSFAVTNASAIYTSTYTQMNAEFGSSREVATVGLSLFVLGIALGPFWSPLAEFLGRRKIYIVAFGAYLIWIIPSAVAQNIQTMIIARFFQGLAGSAFLSVSGGTVGDLFNRRDMQTPMAIFTISPFIGPSLGPMFGGFINSYTHWRWTHYVLLIWAASLLVAIVLLVPETYHPVLLKEKAQIVRKQTGDGRWKAPLEISNKSLLMTLRHTLMRPFQMLAYEPMCLILDLYSAILLGILYLFFGAFPLVFENNHNFTLWQVGLTFLGLLVAMIVGACSTPVWAKIRDSLAEKRGREAGDGVPRGEPEDQLPPAIVGAPLITAGLFWFGFTTYSSVPWMVPIIGSAVFGVGMSLVFMAVFTFLVDAYPLYAASALAGNAFVRCSAAAAFPLFGIEMYEKLGYQWATALLAFLTLAMLPFPYLFFRYGKKIRAKSRFATSG